MENSEQKEVNDPVKNFYLQGRADVACGRKRMRPVPHMYKLAYSSGWWDAKMMRGDRYNPFPPIEKAK